MNINDIVMTGTSKDDILLNSAREASWKAMRISKAMGLPIKIIRNGKIILIDSEGEEKILRAIDKPSTKYTVKKR